MKRKKTTAFLLAASMALTSLAGMGASAEEHEPITVTWLDSYNEEGITAWTAWLKETVEAKYPYITMDMQTYSGDSIDQIVKTKIASDDAPGIFVGLNNQEYVDAGYVYDLSGEEWMSNIQDDVLEAGVFGDIQAYVPMDINYYGIFYNKEIFEKLNLEVPTTLTELRTVCDKLVENDITPFASGFADAWTLLHQDVTIWMTLCCGGYGGYEKNKTWFTDKESLQANFTDDEPFAKAFEIVYSLKDYFSDNAMATDYATALNMVATGEAAMLAGGSWIMDGVLSVNPDMQMSAFPMPVSESPEDSVFVAEPGAGSMCFNSEDPEMLDACLKVFEIMYSPESGQKYAELGNKISAFKDVDMSFNESVADLLQFVADGKSWSNGDIKQFQGGGFGIIQSRLQEYIMKDELDTEGLLKDLDADFKAVF